jgi:hypothetical protein
VKTTLIVVLAASLTICVCGCHPEQSATDQTSKPSEGEKKSSRAAILKEPKIPFETPEFAPTPRTPKSSP